jgi:hypothetical protein
MFSGKDPSKRFSYRFSDPSDKPHNSPGIAPVNSFIDTSNLDNDVKLDIPDDNSPESELLYSSIWTTPFNFVIELGIDPLSLFKNKSRFFRLVKPPRLAGI